MQVVTAAQMKERDRWATEEIGLPELVLMENAGRQVARVVRRLLGDPTGKRVWVFVGKGNNGGDGLVVGRHLAKAGARVEVFLTCPGNQLRGAAATNLAVYQRLGLPMEELTPTTLGQLATRPAQPDLVVDALLGTGTCRPVVGFLAQVIAVINATKCPVVAVDVPSGLDADDGSCPGAVVRARHTVTLDLPKPGLCVFPGAEQAGTLWVAEIGMPPGAPVGGLELALPSLVRALLPPRPRESHKGNWGRVLVVAGARGMAGAAVLAAQAALRSGAGLVTVATPVGIWPQVAAQVAEAMTRPLPETVGGGVAPAALDELLSMAATADVVALGPGLGRDRETVELVENLLPRLTAPLVLDADGLNALIGATGLLAQVHGPVVITPHPGEMARLAGVSTATIQGERLAVARRVAVDWQVTVCLKGARTVIAAPSGQATINPTGNPGLASGGTGDVLTGVIAGLVGQGLSPYRAAVAGAFLHGAAGDLAAASLVEEGLVAGDVVKYLPKARQALASGGDLVSFVKLLP